MEKRERETLTHIQAHAHTHTHTHARTHARTHNGEERLVRIH